MSALLTLKSDISLDNGYSWHGQHDKISITEATKLLYRIELTNNGDVKFNIIWVYVNNVGTLTFYDVEPGKTTQKTAPGGWVQGMNYFAFANCEYGDFEYYEVTAETEWIGVTSDSV